MPRHALALDLKDDPQLIAAYEEWHRKVWPEIQQSIIDSGIDVMQIFRTGNRLFMIIETNESFSFDRKAGMDATNPKVQEWEKLMDQFQQRLPWAKQGEKWVLMDKLFELRAEKN
jgi:L-rhamnose mutarotase